jgi:hypothetical protein
MTDARIDAGGLLQGAAAMRALCGASCSGVTARSRVNVFTTNTLERRIIVFDKELIG